MNKFTTIIIVISSIVIIVSCAYFKGLKEGLKNNDNIVLIGDSVLNNSNYVSAGKSVVEILKTKTPNVFNFSKDGATIRDCYEQIDKIPLILNKTNTTVFISAGGNDILNNRTQLNSQEIGNIFNNYIELLKTVKARLDNANINVLNLYLPINPRYQSYKPSIDQWNQLIKDSSSKIGETYNVINLDTLLTSPTDFVYDIEPSETGSEKIASSIYLTL